MQEPQHIRDILPGTMKNILARCNRRRTQQGLPLFDKAGSEVEDSKERVVQAVGDFLSGKRSRKKRAKRAGRIAKAASDV